VEFTTVYKELRNLKVEENRGHFTTSTSLAKGHSDIHLIIRKRSQWVVILFIEL